MSLQTKASEIVPALFLFYKIPHGFYGLQASGRAMRKGKNVALSFPWLCTIHTHKICFCIHELGRLNEKET